MSKPGVCCDECVELIAQKSVVAARLWLDLCNIQMKSHKIFGLKIDDIPELRFLEERGFITTTDTPDILIIKVHGMQIDRTGYFFCGGYCD